MYIACIEGLMPAFLLREMEASSEYPQEDSKNGEHRFFCWPQICCVILESAFQPLGLIFQSKQGEIMSGSLKMRLSS